MPKTSIVIRSKNEESYIGQTLGAIFEQDEQDFEVIIVDSGSRDKTLEIASSYPVKIIRIRETIFTYGRALNIGIRNSTGDFIVSLSAHALPTDGQWLRHLLAAFADLTVAGVYGRHVPRANATKLEVWGMHWGGTIDGQRRRQTRDFRFSNANGAIRRQIWEFIPFDESLSGGEDFVWAKQVQDLGYAIVYEPAAAVYHSHGEGFWRLMRRQVQDKPVLLRLYLGLESSHWRRMAKRPLDSAPGMRTRR
ncbi:MAG: glycosyltransferase [Chloroflexi bacterium]|nr:glycosyltransferase [Chloroflexota bacterium]MCL5076017.1 glycosyltransferase [Chloroflexota bacterium]